MKDYLEKKMQERRLKRVSIKQVENNAQLTAEILRSNEKIKEDLSNKIERSEKRTKEYVDNTVDNIKFPESRTTVIEKKVIQPVETKTIEKVIEVREVPVEVFDEEKIKEMIGDVVNTKKPGDTIWKPTRSGVVKLEQLMDVDVSGLSKTVDGKFILNSITEGSVSGWGQYIDTQYTEQSPFSVSNGTIVNLPNNSGSVINRLPVGYNDFYDGSKVRPWASGDRLAMSIRLKVKSSVNKGALNIKLDIGGNQGNILSDSRYLIRGAGIEQLINFEMTPYCLDTFIQNGGQLEIESIYGDLEVYDINYVIGKLN